MNIYIGNLAWKAKKQDLIDLFENFGEVTRAFIVRDKRTRRSKGFGFVEMTSDESALAAIEALNNTVFHERAIIVNEANPRKEDLEEADQDDTISGSETDDPEDTEVSEQDTGSTPN